MLVLELETEFIFPLFIDLGFEASEPLLRTNILLFPFWLLLGEKNVYKNMLK
jgi:hypothetical protein